MRLSSNNVVSLLYLLPSLAVLGIWYMMLFTSNGATTPASTLMFVLSEEPRHFWFWWLLALPAFWVALAAAYMTPIAAKRVGAATLLCLGVLLAIGVWVTLSVEIAIFASLPVVYGAMRSKVLRSAAV